MEFDQSDAGSAVTAAVVTVAVASCTKPLPRSAGIRWLSLTEELSKLDFTAVPLQALLAEFTGLFHAIYSYNPVPHASSLLQSISHSVHLLSKPKVGALYAAYE